jgi:hypothetical protein
MVSTINTTTHVAPSSRKVFPYLIYSTKTYLNVHVRVFRKIIQANGEKQDANVVKLFWFTLRDAISKWGKKIM